MERVYKKIDMLQLNSDKEELSDDIFLETQDYKNKDKNILYDKREVAKKLEISMENFNELFADYTIEIDM